MSYTLKLRWTSHDRHGILADELTLFIPADEIRVHGTIVEIDGETPAMQSWEPEAWQDYRCVAVVVVPPDDELATKHSDGRLIAVTRNGVETYYVASNAWLLGPTGSTIERVGI